MIQRIQSIYLLLAGIFPAITFFVPISHYTGQDKSLIMYSLGYDANMCQEMIGNRPYGLLILTVLAVIIPLLTIFGFKNRKRQIHQINLSVLVNIGWYITYAAYAFSISSNMNLDYSFDVCAILPILALISLKLASRAIKKDEALIKAADRIR